MFAADRARLLAALRAHLDDATAPCTLSDLIEGAASPDALIDDVVACVAGLVAASPERFAPRDMAAALEAASRAADAFDDAACMPAHAPFIQCTLDQLGAAIPAQAAEEVRRWAEAGRAGVGHSNVLGAFTDAWHPALDGVPTSSLVDAWRALDYLGLSDRAQLVVETALLQRYLRDPDVDWSGAIGQASTLQDAMDAQLAHFRCLISSTQYARYAYEPRLAPLDALGRMFDAASSFGVPSVQLPRGGALLRAAQLGDTAVTDADTFICARAFGRGTSAAAVATPAPASEGAAPAGPLRVGRERRRP